MGSKARVRTRLREALISLRRLLGRGGAQYDWAKDGYVRSATYFGRDWQINFWNSGTEGLEDDLAGIAADGFTSIILVIPWRELQPTIDPVTYQDYPFMKLRRVLQAAAAHHLDVYVRLGYFWDLCPDGTTSLSERIFALFAGGQALTAWKAYAKRLYDELRPFQNFRGAFLTWEDFWWFFSIPDLQADERLARAQAVGYQDWLRGQTSLEAYNERFGTSYQCIEDIPFPYQQTPEMEAMYQYFDDWLNGLLAATQEVFPGISLEVRIDEDPIFRNGKLHHTYCHEATYHCGTAPFTAVMYGVPMGFENQGERVTAAETLERTEGMLSRLLQKNGGKSLYVEQFIFCDNTPQCAHNARLKEEEILPYLQGAAPILRRCSRGYGIWTYRDYENNALYNPNFALKGRGWDVQGTCAFSEGVCRMEAGAAIAQRLTATRISLLCMSLDYLHNTRISIDVTAAQEGSVLRVTLGDFTQDLPVDQPGLIRIRIPALGWEEEHDFSLFALQGALTLGRVSVWSHVTEGGVRHVDGSPYPYLAGVRALNAALAH